MLWVIALGEGKVEEEAVANWSKRDFMLIHLTLETIDDILLQKTCR